MSSLFRRYIAKTVQLQKENIQSINLDTKSRNLQFHRIREISNRIHQSLSG